MAGDFKSAVSFSGFTLSIKRMNESPYTINSNSEKRYYHGWINWFFRQYFYVMEGNNNLGQFRTLAYFLIGFGLIFNIAQDNYKLLGSVGVAVVPILWVLGYIMATRGNKSLDYFRMKNLATFSKYAIEMQERNIKQQDEIISELKKLNENIFHGTANK